MNIMLCNGPSVDPDFLDVIRDAVVERLPLLPPDVGLPLKVICGKDFWSQLYPGEQKKAGWCMVHLVKTGDLPFRIAESRHEYPVHYQLK